MKRFLLLTFFFCISASAFARDESCSGGIVKEKVDYLADNFFGLKCDPLDKQSLKDHNFKSPCECLTKGEKFTRIKEALFQKNRDRRYSAIKNLLEKKVAEVLRSQVDAGFEQSLRLDTLLKQGKIEFNREDNNSLFPSNCRAERVGELIEKMNGSRTCDQKIFKKRLKLFLNGKDSFAEYLEDKRDNTYSYVAMNALSEKDKKNGMCIPFKTFQSLNNQNPLRPTYLKIAETFKNVGGSKEFQSWATNRSNPNDVFLKISVKKRSEEFAADTMKNGKFPMKLGGMPARGPMANMIGAL